MARTLSWFGLFILISGCHSTENQPDELSPIVVSGNKRFLQYENGDPFFWLGDTGWLLFHKLDRADGQYYLNDRKSKGFNVIQVMLLHSKRACNIYGDSALQQQQLDRPLVTDGNSPDDSAAYDYWDHVEYLIDVAAENGIYMALVPVWGSPVSEDKVTVAEARAYATFLASRFGRKRNVIWLNGGDIRGDNHIAVWNAIGQTLDSLDHEHLISFHPRGRTSSAEWFHNSPWLDFNMFQSGHRNYEQDTARDSHRFGPDNWKYVQMDYSSAPIKPTLDGEPSYEGIPQGLHDTTQVYWNADDVRRYAYWSVFSGGAGFTYGHNAVMQFYRRGEADASYGPKENWKDALQSPGAQQMQYLTNLLLSFPYLEREPDQSLVINPGERYDFIAATKGKRYALIYTYTGRDIHVNMGRIDGRIIKASWFNPRTGETKLIDTLNNSGQHMFQPLAEPKEGNDWVLVLESFD